MKKTAIFLLLFVFAFTVKAAPPYYATILYSRSVGGFWQNSGDAVTFSFGGTVVGGTFSNMVLQVGCNEQDFYDSTNFVAMNGTWNVSGSLVLAGTNLQVSIQFNSSDTNHSYDTKSFVLTNFNAGTNVIYLYQACDCGTAVLTSSNLASPYLPIYDVYGAWKGSTNPVLARVSTGDAGSLSNYPASALPIRTNLLANLTLPPGFVLTCTTNSDGTYNGTVVNAGGLTNNDSRAVAFTNNGMVWYWNPTTNGVAVWIGTNTVGVGTPLFCVISSNRVNSAVGVGRIPVWAQTSINGMLHLVSCYSDNAIYCGQGFVSSGAANGSYLKPDAKSGWYIGNGASQSGTLTGTNNLTIGGNLFLMGSLEPTNGLVVVTNSGPLGVTNGLSGPWNSNGIADYWRTSVAGSTNFTDHLLFSH